MTRRVKRRYQQRTPSGDDAMLGLCVGSSENTVSQILSISFGLGSANVPDMALGIGPTAYTAVFEMQGSVPSDGWGAYALSPVL